MKAKNRPLIRILQIVLALVILPALVVAASLPMSSCEAKYVLNESLTINLNVEMTEPVEPTNPTWPVNPDEITVTDGKGNSVLFQHKVPVEVYIPLAGTRTWSKQGSLSVKSENGTYYVTIGDNSGHPVTVTIKEGNKTVVSITWEVLDKAKDANDYTYVLDANESNLEQGIIYFKISQKQPESKSENLSEDRLTAQDSVTTVDETIPVSEAAESAEAIPHTDETSTGESTLDIEKASTVETTPVAETSTTAETSQSTEAP